MSGLNKVQLIGRLGKDPELKNLQNGGIVCNFSMATSEEWKDKQSGEKKSKTEWHNIVLWGPVATIAGKYLHKGDQCYIEGKLTTRSWEKDGVTRYTTEVQGSNLVLLGGNKGGGEPPEQRAGTTTTVPKEDPFDTKLPDNSPTDDLPF